MSEAAEAVFEALVACLPDEAAAERIKAKPAVLAETYRKLLPELKARAFTITGIERADTLQRVRDAIAEIPRGADWVDVRAKVLSEIGPEFATGATSEERDAQWAAAERRAELIVRHHGFQAYQAGWYDLLDRQKAVFPYWQYVTVGDANVRDEHAALDGLTLPADSPFWATHWPPWEWGCRCRVEPVDAEEYAEIAEGGREYGRALSDVELRNLERSERLALPNGQVINVGARQGDGAFHWHPRDLRIPLDELRDKYAPEVFAAFEREMKSARIEETGETVWEWLNRAKLAAAESSGSLPFDDVKKINALGWTSRSVARRIVSAEDNLAGSAVEKAIIFDKNGRMIHVQDGTASHVEVAMSMARMARSGVATHWHPRGGSFSLDDIKFAFTYGVKELRARAPEGVYVLMAKSDHFKARDYANVERAWRRLFPAVRRAENIGEAAHRMMHRIAEENGFVYGLIPGGGK